MSSVEVRSFAESHSAPGGVPGVGSSLDIDTDMRHVLGILAGLDGRPLEELTAERARLQPTVTTALNKLLRGRAAAAALSVEFRIIDGPGGELRARVYTPPVAYAPGGAPIVLYIHDGGWVVGDTEDYDGSARAICRKAGAVVVSVEHRLAPEHRFPAAHEDCYAAWKWLVDHAESLGGSAQRMAVAGEGSGANMALNIALRARAERLPAPVHQVLISPMAGSDVSAGNDEHPSNGELMSAAMIEWFYDQLLEDEAQRDDPRLNLIERRDLGGIAPATIILAELDPLRAEGAALAAALRRSGVWVDCTTYEGVTHRFFGLGEVVNKAMFAQSQVGRNLMEAFAR